jgi:hypothetical protein
MDFLKDLLETTNFADPLEIELNECYNRIITAKRLYQQSGIQESLDEQNLPELLYQAEQQFIAARKGLGLTNKLKDPEQRKKHRSRVMKTLNRLRRQIAEIEGIVRP